MSSTCPECACFSLDSVPTRAPKSTCRTGSCPIAWSTPARTITTRPAAGSPQPTSRPPNRGTRSWPSGPSRCRYLNTTGDEIHWDMIRLAFSSVADTAIIPLQDILGLDSRARMNIPGKAEGNWRWRFQKGQIDQRAQDRLAELTAVYSRWNGRVPEDLDPRSRPPKPDRVADGRDPSRPAKPLRRRHECTKSNAGSRYEPCRKEP